MPIVYAAAASHAPGITAWPDAAPANQRDGVRAAFAEMRDQLRAARPDALIVLTSEHWTNFFLDHVGAFCVGRGDAYPGPVEPWLNIERVRVPGDPALASELLAAAYARDVEPSFAHELELDHGTILPLHFLVPEMNVPVVPIIFNTLAPPQPSAARSYAFGKIIGDVARASPRRIGIVATGGMSHDPGERRHGIIDGDFDRRFLDVMARADTKQLTAYTSDDFNAAGQGAFELLAWIALQGALGGAPGRVLDYHSATAWATGVGFMLFDAA